ncbi:MAG: isopentenyl phosphate kinase [Candidatus Diapherotrites archaeon]|nr:isopentenyl phosphate kinase family protein [Candidatus Micrarchaeota archaeon]MBU1940088.1 isopentenyl phosphate kinase family protein [Candidatus Micrarchaeota archaeon]
MDFYITKLGGSVITNKESGEASVREEAVARIADEIKRASTKAQFKLVVVLGAGPFGHVPVEKYGINNGVRTDEQKKGYEETRKSMRSLAGKITEIFASQGVNAKDVQDSAGIKQKNKDVVEFETSHIRQILGQDNSTIPLMYGDMVPDSELGASVISGDVIVSHLAKKLNAKKVFFGTDVDGIYSSDPKSDNGAEAIKKITSENFSSVLEGVSGSSATDVTSGMRGKLESIQKNLSGVHTVVFNLNTADNLYRLLKGETGIGTEVLL